MTGLSSHSYQLETIAFTAADGFGCNLIHVLPKVAPSKGPVLLVHGAGVRANIFMPPVNRSFVTFLVEAGYDVWLENWRASIDFAPNEWVLDEAALYDHPAAVKTVLDRTGADTLKAVIHCQGSTSFMMAAAAGLLPEVTTIVSNAVALNPVLPRLSKFKLDALVRLAGAEYPYMNPQWGLRAPTLRAKIVADWVALTHHECNNPVCKMASFVYGIGFPTLWRHEQLNDATHEWIKGEFAAVPRSFFRQMSKSVSAGALVAVHHDDRLPDSFVNFQPRTDARFAFFAGEQNRCFLPKSQERTFDQFDKLRPGYHSLHILPGYAHLDVFIGKRADQDVFPLMVRELDRPC